MRLLLAFFGAGVRSARARYARNKPKVAEKASANNTERNRELRETVLQPEKKNTQAVIPVHWPFTAAVRRINQRSAGYTKSQQRSSKVSIAPAAATEFDNGRHRARAVTLRADY